MRTISLDELEVSPDLYTDAADVLRDGGLLCLPIGRHYGIVASLFEPAAVTRLVQSKRRSRRAPSLVLVPDRAAITRFVDEVPTGAEALMDALWPGPLTVLLRPGGELPRKVLKTLAARRQDRLGVRVVHEPISRALIERFGGPVLVSSANLSKKVGSSSLAQVRKNFARTIDLLIEAGDVPARDPSTVVDPETDRDPIVREGAVPRDRVVELLTAAGG